MDENDEYVFGSSEIQHTVIQLDGQVASAVLVVPVGYAPLQDLGMELEGREQV